MKVKELIEYLGNEDSEVIIESSSGFFKIEKIEENKELVIIHVKGLGVENE